MALLEMQYDSGNGFGTRITLSDNVDYTCPSDGYFRYQCDYSKGNYCKAYINGQQVGAVTSNAAGNTTGMAETPLASMFVKQGMILKYTGTTGSYGFFYPIT